MFYNTLLLLVTFITLLQIIYVLNIRQIDRQTNRTAVCRRVEVWSVISSVTHAKIRSQDNSNETRIKNTLIRYIVY